LKNILNFKEKISILQERATLAITFQQSLTTLFSNIKLTLN